MTPTHDPSSPTELRPKAQPSAITGWLRRISTAQAIALALSIAAFWGTLAIVLILDPPKEYGLLLFMHAIPFLGKIALVSLAVLALHVLTRPLLRSSAWQVVHIAAGIATTVVAARNFMRLIQMFS